MKKIILILAVVGVMISCSNENEIIKKEATTEIIVENKIIIPEEKAIVEDTIDPLQVEEITLDVKDYESVSEPVKKLRKKIKSTSKSIEKEVAIEEKAVPIETSIDEDVDKLIAKTETQAKVIEEKNQEKESTNNKTIFGALGAILVAGAAVFVFKNK